MPNTFKNQLTHLTVTPTSVYTAPAATGNVAIVLLAQAANVSSGTQSVTLCIYDNAGSPAKLTDLALTLSVPANAAVGLIAGKLVLTEGQHLYANSTASLLIDMNISVLEIT
jgi:hypothetical protein|tara:strand:- start:116 stop:451 length:336 start_codon:yes stop_codon:yes gene_type:complete